MDPDQVLTEYSTINRPTTTSIPQSARTEGVFKL